MSRRSGSIGTALLQVLLPSGCAHQFSWPRITTDGRLHYQTCMICGVQYQYDWHRMKRLRRLDPERLQRQPAYRPRRRWLSRARRVKFITPVEYRVRGTEKWFPGLTRNISQSGLLLVGEQHLDLDTKVELKFEMPRDVLGHDPCRVTAIGCIVRHQDAPEGSAYMAVNIWDCEVPLPPPRLLVDPNSE